MPNTEPPVVPDADWSRVRILLDGDAGFAGLNQRGDMLGIHPRLPEWRSQSISVCWRSRSVGIRFAGGERGAETGGWLADGYRARRADRLIYLKAVSETRAQLTFGTQRCVQSPDHRGRRSVYRHILVSDRRVGARGVRGGAWLALAKSLGAKVSVIFVVEPPFRIDSAVA